MGEIADAMVNGFLCEKCGAVIDYDEPGYPRTCGWCLKAAAKHVAKKARVKSRRRNKR